MNVGMHAILTFREVEAEGPAHRPLDFPPPQVRRGVKVTALVVHPETGRRDILPNVIHRASYLPENKSRGKDDVDKSSSSSRAKGKGKLSTSESSASDSKAKARTTKQKQYTAYFPQRRLQDAIYGSVWCCLVLERHYGSAADDAARAANLDPGDPSAPIVWEITGRHVAIKMVEWARVHQARGRLLEDPVKEIAAMQLIGTEHPHVLGSEEVLQDDDYLYSIMPYANGGDLFGYVIRDAEKRADDGGMDEAAARYWFRQILQVRPTLFQSAASQSLLKARRRLIKLLLFIPTTVNIGLTLLTR